MENAGSEISSKQSKCCGCKLFKEHDQSEIPSVRKEVEQYVVSNSVDVNFKNEITIASLLFK